MSKRTKHPVTRRTLLKGAAAVAGAAAGSGALTGFPTIWAQNIKDVVLRQFGTGVSNQNPIAEQCKKDLGFTLQMTALDSDAVTQRAVTQPKSYDIADIEYWICKKVFPGGRAAADGCQAHQVFRGDRADLHHRQAHARNRRSPRARRRTR